MSIDVRKTAAALARASFTQLLKRLQRPGPVPADLLSVARVYMGAAGHLGGPLKPRQREQLEAIYEAYVRQLQAAIQQPAPPAAVFQEVRRFLDSQRIGKDAEAGQALEALGSAALPFNGPTTHQ